MTSGTLLQTLIGHSDFIYALAKLENNLLASGSDDATTKIWNLTSSKLLQTLVSDRYGIQTLILLDNNLLASAYLFGINVWNVTSETLAYNFQSEFYPLYLPLAKLNYTLLASASIDNSIKIWDLKLGIQRFNLTGHTDEITTLISCDNTKNLLLASGSKDKTIKIWNFNLTSRSSNLLYDLIGHSSYVTSLVSFNDESVVSSSYDSTILVWNI